MTTLEWTAFFVLLLAALAAGAAVTFSNGAVTRAIRRLETTYRREKSLELEQLQAQAVDRRRAEVAGLLDRPDGWRAVLDRVLADALPETGARIGRIGQDGLLDLNATPAPRFTVAGTDGAAYLFTTSPATLRRLRMIGRKDAAIPLDASLAPTARIEVDAVWEHLAAERLRDQAPVLPRQTEWFLVVREGGK